jgi:hypothetical protein
MLESATATYGDEPVNTLDTTMSLATKRKKIMYK